jgi:hypothetical protein
MSSSYHSAHENNHDHAMSSGRVMNRFAITHALNLQARDYSSETSLQERKKEKRATLSSAFKAVFFSSNVL